MQMPIELSDLKSCDPEFYTRQILYLQDSLYKKTGVPGLSSLHPPCKNSLLMRPVVDRSLLTVAR